MTKKYLVSVVENICSGPGAARSVKRLQVCSPCSALAPNLGPAVGCWRLVTATIQPPEPEPERERESNRDCHNKRREHQMHNIHTTCDFGSFVVLTMVY